ncbi:hypothetical protein [Ehrlichia canis]|uniref:Uncharacterized protein n=1 Tax=Ehrlichia canis (strain Jake) TaxID=269484 RepID=A0ACA6AVQ4_EHRCJ|nr:hypothetical protein [Ehrlichia canis]AAZ68422.1 hypothetical protein Ecaj_0379 [Ehrlichia canis str. Jake]
MIDSCNNYHKLCKIDKEIITLLRIAQDESLLNAFSEVKHEASKEEQKLEIEEENNVLILENDDNNKDTEEIKNHIKLKLNILMSVIAHKMDPVQRAGETAQSNTKDSKKFGRSAAQDLSVVTTALFKMILNQIKLILEVAITNEKSENQQFGFQKELHIDPEQQSHLPNLVSQEDNQQSRSR